MYPRGGGMKPDSRGSRGDVGRSGFGRRRTAVKHHVVEALCHAPPIKGWGFVRHLSSSNMASRRQVGPVERGGVPGRKIR